MKKSLCLAILGVLVMGGPVFASSGEESKTETKTVVNGETKLEVSVNQSANIQNDVDEHVNTGENEVENNTACCGEITTGAASNQINTGTAAAEVEVKNNVNTANVVVAENQEQEEAAEEEGQSPAEIEVPVAEESNVTTAQAAPTEESGQLAAEVLPESGPNNVIVALILSGILFLAAIDLKKYLQLKSMNLV